MWSVGRAKGSSAGRPRRRRPLPNSRLPNLPLLREARGPAGVRRCGRRTRRGALRHRGRRGERPRHEDRVPAEKRTAGHRARGPRPRRVCGCIGGRPLRWPHEPLEDWASLGHYTMPAPFRGALGGIIAAAERTGAPGATSSCQAYKVSSDFPIYLNIFLSERSNSASLRSTFLVTAAALPSNDGRHFPRVCRALGLPPDSGKQPGRTQEGKERSRQPERYRCIAWRPSQRHHWRARQRTQTACLRHEILPFRHRVELPSLSELSGKRVDGFDVFP